MVLAGLRSRYPIPADAQQSSRTGSQVEMSRGAVVCPCRPGSRAPMIATTPPVLLRTGRFDDVSDLQREVGGAVQLVDGEAKLIHEQAGDDDTDHAKHDRRDSAVGKDCSDGAEDADEEHDDAESHATGRCVTVEEELRGRVVATLVRDLRPGEPRKPSRDGSQCRAEQADQCCGPEGHERTPPPSGRTGWGDCRIRRHHDRLLDPAILTPRAFGCDQWRRILS